MKKIRPSEGVAFRINIVSRAWEILGEMLHKVGNFQQPNVQPMGMWEFESRFCFSNCDTLSFSH
jgi:hypothetical protein